MSNPPGPGNPGLAPLAPDQPPQPPQQPPQQGPPPHQMPQPQQALQQGQYTASYGQPPNVNGEYREKLESYSHLKLANKLCVTTDVC